MREAIAPALDRLDPILESVIVDPSSHSAAAVLTDLIEHEVRPVSHRLATQPGSVPTFVRRTRDQRRIRVPLPDRVNLAEGFRPGFAAVLYLSVVPPNVVRHNSLDVAVIWLLWATSVSFLVLIVVKAMLHPSARGRCRQC